MPCWAWLPAPLGAWRRRPARLPAVAGLQVLRAAVAAGFVLGVRPVGSLRERREERCDAQLLRRGAAERQERLRRVGSRAGRDHAVGPLALLVQSAARPRCWSGPIEAADRRRGSAPPWPCCIGHVGVWRAGGGLLALLLQRRHLLLLLHRPRRRGRHQGAHQRGGQRQGRGVGSRRRRRRQAARGGAGWEADGVLLVVVAVVEARVEGLAQVHGLQHLVADGRATDVHGQVVEQPCRPRQQHGGRHRDTGGGRDYAAAVQHRMAGVKRAWGGGQGGVQLAPRSGQGRPPVTLLQEPGPPAGCGSVMLALRPVARGRPEGASLVA